MKVIKYELNNNSYRKGNKEKRRFKLNKKSCPSQGKFLISVPGMCVRLNDCLMFIVILWVTVSVRIKKHKKKRLILLLIIIAKRGNNIKQEKEPWNTCIEREIFSYSNNNEMEVHTHL